VQAANREALPFGHEYLIVGVPDLDRRNHAARGGTRQPAWLEARKHVDRPR